jgi:predicted P-loop ATPase
MENAEQKEDNVVEMQIWESGIKADKKGVILNTVNNTHLFLSNHKDMRGVLKFNRFTSNVDILSRPPWTKSPENYPRRLQEVDIIRAAAWLETEGFASSTASTVYACLISAAQINTYDPLMNYLMRLTWDGKPRVKTLLSSAFGAQDTPYSQAVSAKFLVGAVARALQPGCKMDNMLILEGPQGIKKSTAIAELFGRDWFTDELADLGSKDAGLQVQGVWAIEMAELTTLNRSEYNRAKDFLSRQIDRFRAPYAKIPEAHKRRCVFIGTVNPEDGYLRDPTGARRFWPVKCGDIDLAFIKENRDQIWAEAAALYGDGERWWFDKTDDVDPAVEQQERYDEDPWSNQVLEYMEGRVSATIAQVMKEALFLPPNNQTQAAKKRVSSVLISAGYSQHRTRLNGRQVRVYSKEF